MGTTPNSWWRHRTVICCRHLVRTLVFAAMHSIHDDKKKSTCWTKAATEDCGNQHKAFSAWILITRKYYFYQIILESIISVLYESKFHGKFKFCLEVWKPALWKAVKIQRNEHTPAFFFSKTIIRRWLTVPKILGRKSKSWMCSFSWNLDIFHVNAKIEFFPELCKKNQIDR